MVEESVHPTLYDASNIKQSVNYAMLVYHVKTLCEALPSPNQQVPHPSASSQRSNSMWTEGKPYRSVGLHRRQAAAVVVWYRQEL